MSPRVTLDANGLVPNMLGRTPISECLSRRQRRQQLERRGEATEGQKVVFGAGGTGRNASVNGNSLTIVPVRIPRTEIQTVHEYWDISNREDDPIDKAGGCLFFFI